VVASCHRSVMLPPSYSTHNPPHEQWLVRLGVGGVSTLRRLSVPLRPSSPCRQPHIPFERGGGGFGGRGCALRVAHPSSFSVVTSRVQPKNQENIIS
jgi:hypothetical protein